MVHCERQAAQRDLQAVGEEGDDVVVRNGGEEDLVEVGLDLRSGVVGGDGVDVGDLRVVRPELGDQETVMPVLEGGGGGR